MLRPNQVEMGLAEVPPPWEYPVPWAIEVPHTVLCICCSAYLRAFTGLETLFTLIPQFGFPAPQRFGFFSREWHRPGVLIHHRVPLLSSAPCHLFCRVSFLVDSLGQQGTFFCPTLCGEAALCALAFDRSLTSNSYGPKATAVTQWARSHTLCCKSLEIFWYPWATSLAGSESPPCFWHLGIFLSFKLSDVLNFFLILSSASWVHSGMQSLC